MSTRRRAAALSGWEGTPDSGGLRAAADRSAGLTSPADRSDSRALRYLAGALLLEGVLVWQAASLLGHVERAATVGVGPSALSYLVHFYNGIGAALHMGF